VLGGFELVDSRAVGAAVELQVPVLLAEEVAGLFDGLVEEKQARAAVPQLVLDERIAVVEGLGRIGGVVVVVVEVMVQPYLDGLRRRGSTPALRAGWLR
jgi:hypothetical protein